MPAGIENVWLNTSIPSYFVDYADLIFDHFSGRITNYLTFNEPAVFIKQGYEDLGFPPGPTDDGRGKDVYQAAHNMLISHAKAVEIFRQKNYPGRIGITLNGGWNVIPQTKHDIDDIETGFTAEEFYVGWFANPVYKRDYPEIMKYRLGNRLPKFSEEELDLLSGSSDFFGLNYYASDILHSPTHDEFQTTCKPWDGTCEYEYAYACDIPELRCAEKCDSWPSSGSSWLKPSPFAFRIYLRWLRDRYGMPIFVTENGVSSRDSDMINPLEDLDTRGWVYENNINQIMRAVIQDDVDVIGYAAWSLMDNYFMKSENKM